MLENGQFKNKEAWQENAKLWQTYEPPLRPSPGDLLIYDLALQTFKGEPFSKKALLLGDCPELRDLLAEHQYNTTVVANNPIAIIAMNELLTFTGEKKEKVIIMNWQDIDFEPNSYDLVLSDWGLNSLTEWLDYTLVLYKVAQVMKNNANFITRINIYKPERKIRSVKQIMSDFAALPQHKFSFLLELEMYSTISTYNEKTFQIDLGKFYRDEVTAAYHNGQMTFAEWQEFYYPFFDVVMTYPRQADWENLLHKFFTITAVKYGGDYLASDNNPIYICQKNINQKIYG